MGRESGARKRQPPPLDVATATPFGVALGHRMRRAREDTDRSADRLASDARLLGLGWDRPTVTRAENGQRPLSAAELLVLPLLYGRSLADLLPTEPVALTEAAAVAPATLRRSLVDAPKGMRGWALPRLHDAATAAVETMKPAAEALQSRYPNVDFITLLEAATDGWTDEATGKAAKRLDVERRDVAVAARRLWRRGLAAERDRRLSASGDATTARARQARRGHITRVLLAELRPVLDELQHAREESGSGQH